MTGRGPVGTLARRAIAAGVARYVARLEAEAEAGCMAAAGELESVHLQLTGARVATRTRAALSRLEAG